MDITLKVWSKEYQGFNKKETYLKGCKSVAKFCRKKYENTNIFIVPKYKGQDASGLHTFEFEIYTSLNFEKEFNKQCTRCKEFHKSFFLTEERNCSVCTLNSFGKRMREALNISKEAYLKKLE